MHIIDACIVHNENVHVHHDQSAFIAFQFFAQLLNCDGAFGNMHASLVKQMMQHPTNLCIINELCAVEQTLFVPLVMASAHLHHLHGDVCITLFGQIADDA